MIGPRLLVPTLIFDGKCAFCTQVADDAARHARGVSFQARLDAGLAPELLARSACSVLWIDGARVLDGSAAVVRLLWHMRWRERVLGAAVWLVPRRIRDAGYRWAGRRWGPLASRPECAPGKTLKR